MVPRDGSDSYGAGGVRTKRMVVANRNTPEAVGRLLSHVICQISATLRQTDYQPIGAPDTPASRKNTTEQRKPSGLRPIAGTLSSSLGRRLWHYKLWFLVFSLLCRHTASTPSTVGTHTSSAQ